MVERAKLGRGRYGRPYGWYGPYGHDRLKTYVLGHLKLFEGCENIGHWCTVMASPYSQGEALI